MADFKAWASRRLREMFGESADRNCWTQHGSTRYLNTEPAVAGAIAYVLEEHGKAMAHFDSRHQPEVSATSARHPIGNVSGS